MGRDEKRKTGRKEDGAKAEARALADLHHAIQKDLVAGREPSVLEEELQAAGLSADEARELVDDSWRTLFARRKVEPPPTISPLPARRSRRPDRWLVLAAVLAIAAGVAGARFGPRWFQDRRATANERAALADLRAFRDANAGLAPLNAGAFVGPETLADPSRVPAGTAALDPRFRGARRAGYDFTYVGDQEREGATLGPAFRAYAYVARPSEPGRTGRRSYALYSYLPGIYTRDDAQLPTVEDRTVD